MICPICIGNKLPFIALGCKHKFHHHCILKWFQEKHPYPPSCPCCRRIQDFDEIKIPIMISSLMLSAQYGDIERIKSLLQQGALIDEEDFEGCTAFSYAVINNQFDIASLLIFAGANINHKDKNNSTVLITLSCITIKTNRIKFLLDHDVDTEIEDSLGDTPLEIAAYSNNFNALEVFLQYGIKKKIKSALCLAERFGSIECVELLNKYIR